MNKILMANLKMNLNNEDMVIYKKTIEESGITDLYIYPSFLYLNDMKSDKYNLGAQTGYQVDKGAFTGETSFYQLNKLGIKYSLIGHSERRHVFKETDEDISLKMQSCINNNITPVLCVGETKDERLSGNTNSVVERQIVSALSSITLNELTIAYEPVWAIGTGLVPTLDEIKEVHTFIKDLLKDKYNIDVKVLYGGSVNLGNIKSICEVDNVDGVLIGGASNDPNNLINMYKEVN